MQGINNDGHGLNSKAHHKHLVKRLKAVLAAAAHFTADSVLPTVYY